MVRIRSAFLVLFIAVILSFFVGVQAGYFAARSSSLVEGMERWADEVKAAVTSATGGKTTSP
jgi:threonine/homoserine/homoserine lactone efflux protein